jgi:hypothetical protein
METTDSHLGSTSPNQPPSNNDSAPLRGIFDPPDGLVLTALAWHKRVLVVFAILGALAGAAFGLLRPATYEAAATLQVGQVNPNSPGFASYTQSSSSLATAFSRAIAAAPVLASVRRKLHLSEQRAAARLSAEPIALSPAFRVIATGPSEEKARRLANVAAAGVIAYENRSNSANPEAARLLRSYRKAASNLDEASTEIERSAAKIRLKAIGNAYIATIASQPPRTGFVSLLAGATTATSNHSSRIQLYAFLGLLVGALVGAGVSIQLERREKPPPPSAPALRPRPT